MTTSAIQYLDREKELQTIKDPFKDAFEMIGKYVMQTKRHHTSESIPGQFETKDVFDGTAPRALEKSAASILGALFPSAVDTFELIPDIESIAFSGFEGFYEDRETKEYMDEATKRLTSMMDDHQANLIPCLAEAIRDVLGFGTAGVYPRETNDYAMPLYYEVIDVKMGLIDEGKNGRIETVYCNYEWTIRRALEEYPDAEWSKATKDKVAKGLFNEKIKILQVIEKRVGVKVNPDVPNVKDYPYAFVIIEKEAKHIVVEGGFTELPVFVARLIKVTGEVWGRSPAFYNMPEIREINFDNEMSIKATELWLFPPKLVRNESIIGQADLTANATNVMDGSRINQVANEPPIQTIEIVKNPVLLKERIDKLELIISEGWWVDRLLDLNNETEMTLGEANIRNQLRGLSLIIIYAQLIIELISPLIHRAFNVAWRTGRLGVVRGSIEHQRLINFGIEPLVIPDAIAAMVQNGRPPYKINYISPAARMMQSEKLRGIAHTTEFVMNAAQAFPEMPDNFDGDKIASHVQYLSGAPSDIRRAKSEVDELRAQRAAAQQQEAQMLMAQAGAETLRAGAQGVQALSQAEGNRK